MAEIPGKSITLESLEEMFQNISENTDWDTTQNMLWGFFFTHSELSKLELAKEHVESQGYSFVRFFLGDKEDESEADTFWLHVEKKESHDAKSLDARNDELYLFAHEMGIDSYDGMDVGPIDK